MGSGALSDEAYRLSWVEGVGRLLVAVVYEGDNDSDNITNDKNICNEIITCTLRYNLLCELLTSAKNLLRIPPTGGIDDCLRGKEVVGAYCALICYTPDNGNDNNDSRVNDNNRVNKIRHDMLLRNGYIALTNLLASTPSLKSPHSAMFPLLNSTLITSCRRLKESLTIETCYRLVRFLHYAIGTMQELRKIAVLVEDNVGTIVELLGYFVCEKFPREGKENEKETTSLLSPPILLSPPSDSTYPLAIECLKALYAISCSGEGKTYLSSPSNAETVKNLGYVLSNVLHLPNGNRDVYEVKLEAVKLIMEPPADYVQYLLDTGCIDKLLDILHIQSSECVVEKCNDVQGRVLHVLVATRECCKLNKLVKKHVEERIFPAEEMRAAEEERMKELSALPEAEREQAQKALDLKPISSPPHSLRSHLLALLLSLDTNVKRFASELLWEICGDSRIFSKRVGYGRGIHFLGLKGIVKTPKG